MTLLKLMCYYVQKKNKYQLKYETVADLRGAPGTRAPSPLGQNFYIFMQFSGKIRQIVG